MNNDNLISNEQLRIPTAMKINGLIQQISDILGFLVIAFLMRRIKL